MGPGDYGLLLFEENRVKTMDFRPRLAKITTWSFLIGTGGNGRHSFSRRFPSGSCRGQSSNSEGCFQASSRTCGTRRKLDGHVRHGMKIALRKVRQEPLTPGFLPRSSLLIAGLAGPFACRPSLGAKSPRTSITTGCVNPSTLPRKSPLVGAAPALSSLIFSKRGPQPELPRICSGINKRPGQPTNGAERRDGSPAPSGRRRGRWPPAAGPRASAPPRIRAGRRSGRA